MPKILFVEDNPDMQRMFKFILDRAGFETIIADGGRAGVEKVKTDKPDLIVMDIMMPDSSGIQAIKKIKADPENQHIPIVVLSAYSSQKLIDSAFAAGAIAYLEKSVLPEKLVEAVEKHLT